MDSLNWHLSDIKEVCRTLNTDPETGLSENDVLLRRAQYGKNEIEEGKRKSALLILFSQLKDFMIIILMGAAVFSALIGEYIDAIAILVIVILNAIIGFTQEYRADRAILALKNMAAPLVRILRNGIKQDISTTSLVPGDIVFIETGCITPADMRIISQNMLSIDESALTGESISREKIADLILPDTKNISAQNIAEQQNMVFKGTRVVKGRGKAVVTATGMQTELGKIAMLIQSEEKQTPLQKRLIAFSKRITLIILATCLIIFFMGLLRSTSPVLMLLTVISLAVAAIPEALPAVITIALAIGAKKMVKINALVRSLPAVETLGSITYICTDKTGTLTQNKMKVEHLFINGRWIPAENFHNNDIETSEKSLKHQNDEFMAMSLILNNDAQKEASEITGEPTEAALLEAGYKYNKSLYNNVIKIERRAELPFDSDRKRMSTVHKINDKFILFCKGAPEILLERCSKKIYGENELMKFRLEAEEFARKGYRIILFAYKILDQIPEILNESDETNLIFLGFAALMDPPREFAKEAVELCKKAGIATVMITGDHPETAKNIAVKLSIASELDSVITGSQLEKLSEDDLHLIVKKIKIYARVSPLQKVQIVKALQSAGEYVAMTGDGVNDAPALTLAEIGVAMGKRGTDVARESSDIILIDDNFSTIVGAVTEGRRVYDNVRKFIRYILSGNLAEVITITIAPFLGLPIPLIPVQILWINLITDSLPAIALANEKAEIDVMNLPPRHPKESIFARGLGQYIITTGIVITVIVLISQKLFIAVNHWQTIVFTVLSFSQLTQIFAIKSERTGFFKTGIIKNIKSNYWLSASFFLMVVLQICVIYIPFLNKIFKTSPLSLYELLYCLSVPWISFVSAELLKWISNARKHKFNN
ncbi:MAG: calcium-translocating P-type ATPase, PMCA-type [Spirochaetia bacterium]|nr:calcium-translocating P-type ATPase, PMCA-type [Spirochaetia bacterium]